MEIKKLIKIWNAFLESLKIQEKNSSSTPVVRVVDMSQDVENKQYKNLEKAISKNLLFSSNTKEAIVELFKKDWISTREKSEEIPYSITFMHKNYKAMGISNIEMMDILFDVINHAYTTSDILHQIGFFGHISEQINKNNATINYKKLITNTMNEDEKSLISNLAFLFNINAQVHPKLYLDKEVLKLRNIDKGIFKIENKEMVDIIYAKNGFNSNAKDSYLIYSTVNIEKEKFFMDVVKSLIDENQHFSPYEKMKKYLNSQNHNHQTIALFMVIFGSHDILKDITVEDVEKLSGNYLSPHYIKFLNSFYNKDKGLQKYPEILEMFKEESLRISVEKDPILTISKELNNENIQKSLKAIIEDINYLEKTDKETKWFVSQTRKTIIETLNSFLDLKSVTKNFDIDLLISEINHIQESIREVQVKQSQEQVLELEKNQKIVGNKIRK